MDDGINLSLDEIEDGLVCEGVIECPSVQDLLAYCRKREQSLRESVEAAIGQARMKITGSHIPKIPSDTVYAAEILSALKLEL